MQNGTPCVMTSIAAEGMFDIRERLLSEVEVNGFIEDNAEAFAKKAVLLYNTSEIWKQQQKNGFEVLKQRFNRLDFEPEFASHMESLYINLKTHRQQNFIGQLFRHQTMQSTKYMSKWIELKNR